MRRNGHPGDSPRRAALFLACALVAASWAPVVSAGVLLQPGDLQVRNDVQILADGGYLTAPVTGWPLPWASIAADLEDADPRTMSVLQLGAWRRLSAALGVEATDAVRTRVAFSARAGAAPLRWYRDTPRARETISAGVTDGGAGGFSYDLQLAAVHDPDDGREALRPDGSYVSFKAGNWLLDAGWLNRWWGPGWSGSIIYDTNARPAPGVSITRASARPFDLPGLDWLGPWRFTALVDRFDNDRAVPHPYFFGARFEFRPFESLTVGFSRTVEWGGQGMPEDWVHFRDMVLGTSYQDTGVPGSSLAGFDLRWNFKQTGQPFAAYVQEAGEDTSKAYHLPRKFAGLIGFETWGGFGEDGNSYRLFAEYADTTTGFLGLNSSRLSIYNVVYENYQYRSGYRYLGRTLGYPTDNDSRIVNVGAVISDVQARTLSLLLRAGTLNRDDANVPPPGGNPVAPRRTNLIGLETSLSMPLPQSLGRLSIAVGTERLAPAGAGAHFDNHIWVDWSHEF